MKKYLGTSKSINLRNRLTSGIAYLETMVGIFSAVRHTYIPCELNPLICGYITQKTCKDILIN